MSNSSVSLSKRCQAILDGADAAVAWVKDTRRASQRLDREADGLIDRLRRSRNLARRLGAAASRPMSVGFFGLSQAGKSYLISALASDANGELETLLDGERLNFIRHINPPGQGKEATGLVTRFTRNAPSTASGYPVRLTLCSEADVVKILGNSFFSDFDREKVSFDLDPARIRSRLTTLEGRRQPRLTGGMTEDDVVDLKDYFEKRYAKSMEGLSGDYWPTAIELTPYLLPADRAEFFALLWGDIAELTQAYLRLRGGLDALNHARIVDAPLAVLVTPGSAGDWSQQNSIMNVDILNRLGKDDSDTLGVLPIIDGQIGTETGLPRSLLAALTLEMVFALAEPPRAKLLEQVDLIDFPGYRGRLSVTDLDEVRKAVKDSDPVAALILRGKVAYLFERYTDDQEMNVLVMCSPSSEQNNVNSLGPALERWVNSTQGATPEERAKRRPGLAWAITKFDMRLAGTPGETEDNLRIGWDGMMRAALLERFETSKWLQDWSGGVPFNNIFLVRKPGMAAGVIDTQGGSHEIGVSDAQQARLGLMHRTFAEVKAVQKHVQDPDAAWDGMMVLNDGGMGRLAAYLEGVAVLDNKLSRIQEQVDRLVHELTQSYLGGYFTAEGADEVERKKQIVDKVLTSLMRRPTSFGALLHALQPSQEHLRSLYLKADLDPEAEGDQGGSSPISPADDGLISLDDFGLGAEDEAPIQTVTTGGGRTARFCRAVISDWIKDLRQLSDRPEIHRLLGLADDVIQSVVDEVVTGAVRYRLEEKMVAALHAAEEHAATTRNKLAGQQVLVSSMLINDFVDFLGFSAVAPQDRPLADPRTRVAGLAERRIFAPLAPIAPGQLPTLNPKPLNYSAIYIVDWFEAFRSTAIGNAGHAAGSEIPPEQNERLGAILKQIAGATLGAS